jgi:hypothetical protein
MITAKQYEDKTIESTTVEKWTAGKWKKADYIESERGLNSAFNSHYWQKC